MTEQRTLQCPVCTGRPMDPIDSGSTRMWVCAQCKGLATHSRAFSADAVARLTETLVPSRIGKRAINCPACGQRMECLRTRSAPYAEIDHCTSCHALWLDRGEFAAVEHNLRRIAGSAPPPPAAAAVLSGGHGPERAAEIRAESGRLVPSDFDVPDKFSINTDPGGLGEYFLTLLTLVPREMWIRAVRRPLWTYAAIAAMSVIYWFGVHFGGGSTVALEWGIAPTELFSGLKPVQLLTAPWVNTTAAGWLASAYFVWVFGDNVEDAFGRALYPVLCIVFGAIDILGAAWSEPNSTLPIAGSLPLSAGLMGTYLTLFPASRVRMAIWPFWVPPVVLEVPSFAYILFFGVVLAILSGLLLASVPLTGCLAAFVAGVAAGCLYRVTALPRLRRQLLADAYLAKRRNSSAAEHA